MFAWQATVQGEAGNVVPLPVVTVYIEDGVTLASIYTESGIALPNPLTGTLEGFVQFWADIGVYKIEGVSGSDRTEVWSVELGVSRNFFDTRAELVAYVATNPNLKDGAELRADGLSYVWQSGAAAITDMPNVLPSNNPSPRHFGAVGDGVADDTNAVVRSMLYDGSIDWLNKTYRITNSVYASRTSNVNWKSSGARIFLDRTSQVSRSFSLDMNGYNFNLQGTGFEIDAGGKAVTAIRIDDNSALRPDLNAEKLIARNAYRSDKSISGGDGIFISGGFGRVNLFGPEVHDCYMAVGAGISQSQGIFGITITQGSGRYSKHILIKDSLVRNVWSQDPSYTNDQDGIRIFQDMLDADSTCFIDGYICENVSNRAVKLHSGPNCVVQNVNRVLDSSVVPQSVNFQNPDFDSQQASARFRNIKVHYKGICHQELIRVSTDVGQFLYGSGQVSGVDLFVDSVSDNTIRMFVCNSAADNTFYNVSISDVNVVGKVLRILSVNTRGTGENAVVVSNVIADCIETGFVAVGATLAKLEVCVSNVVNLGTPAILSSGFSGARVITTTPSVRGFN